MSVNFGVPHSRGSNSKSITFKPITDDISLDTLTMDTWRSNDAMLTSSLRQNDVDDVVWT